VAPTTTVWDAPQHTLAKIEIVRRYLGAWFPIVARYQGRVLYVDGFAGPGEYERGRDGSPVAAIRAAVDHPQAPNFEHAELVFQFIEQQPARAEHLKQVLRDRFPEPARNVKWQVECADFEPTMNGMLASVEAAGTSIAPTFLFVDPFGWTGVSMATLARLLRHPRTEVLITFMVEHIQRFLADPAQEANFTALFGGDAWKASLDGTEGRTAEALLQCFVEGLRSVARAKYVLPFAMVSAGNRTEYYLVHASNDDKLKAVAAMKAAMWQADPTGQFRFRDRLAGQTFLWGGDVIPEDVQARLVREFSGKSVTFDEIRSFILLGTPYRDTDFNTRGLRPLEQRGGLTVETLPGASGKGRAKFTYPERLRPHLRFHFR